MNMNYNYPTTIYRSIFVHTNVFLFCVKWDNLSTFVAFSMKTSGACTGMLSSENDDFKFLKTAKNIKSRSSRAP